MAILKIKDADGEYTIIPAIRGEKGIGIESITKTKTEGLVDTYTIVYSDKTTQNFTITNGKIPVVGEDYWTEADKEAIVQEVLDNIDIGDENIGPDSLSIYTETELIETNTYELDEEQSVIIHNSELLTGDVYYKINYDNEFYYLKPKKFGGHIYLGNPYVSPECLMLWGDDFLGEIPESSEPFCVINIPNYEKTYLFGLDYEEHIFGLSYLSININSLDENITDFIGVNIMPETEFTDPSSFGFWDGMECIYFTAIKNPIKAGEEYFINFNGIEKKIVSEYSNVDEMFGYSGIILKSLDPEIEIEYLPAGYSYDPKYNLIISSSSITSDIEVGAGFDMNSFTLGIYKKINNKYLDINVDQVITLDKAKVGQIPFVRETNESNKPTKWQAITLPDYRDFFEDMSSNFDTETVSGVIEELDYLPVMNYLDVGKEYKIIHNGLIYYCKVQEYAGQVFLGNPFVSNTSLGFFEGYDLNISDYPQVPFFIINQKIDEFEAQVYFNEGGNHTLAFKQVDLKLPSQYININNFSSVEMIATLEDGTTKTLKLLGEVV